MYTSRRQLFAHLGLVQVVEPATAAAYKLVAEEKWRSEFTESPHGQPWFTSFHASKFPGNPETACGRKAVYGLMNIPDGKPWDRAGLTVVSVGSAIEKELVGTWAKAGILLSAPPEAPIQTGFKDRDTWLTGSVDAVILPEGWNRGHVVEIKSKDQSVVKEMRIGARGPDPEHVIQCGTYIAFANLVSPFKWPDLDPVTTGSIYYLARDRPHMTAEFFFQLDDEMFQRGLALLRQWKQAFLDDVLPERPADFMWTGPACQYCDLKNLKLPDGTKAGCKEDLRQGITKLSDSTTIAFAKSLNPNHDNAELRRLVLERWGEL